MISPQDRQERGQALVLMAFALIGMLGFVAVALDGGNIYAEQRRAQAAADNAVLAAAYQSMRGITSTTTISNSALANAALNDFDNNSTNNWVRFYRPPISGAYAGNAAYLQVVITERIPTALAHLVYKGPFQLSASAVAYAKTGGPPVDGNAIVSLAPHGCQTFFVNGNGTIATTGGGLFANSDGGNPGACTGNSRKVMDAGQGFISSAPPYGINIVDADSTAYSSNISPTPTKGVSAISGDPLSDLNPPRCASGPNTSPSQGMINPGTYVSLNVANDQTLTLNPGLYCITKSGNNAVDLSPRSVLSGTGVTLYVPNGEVNLQQGIVKLKAPSATNNPTECATLMPWDAPDTSVCHYLGMVFFMGRNNTLGVTLNGRAGWVVEGTVYGMKSTVTMTGHGDWALTGQILADKFQVTGNGTVNVNFDPTVIYSPPPTISLVQ